jgi:hypothetical protein
MKGRPASGLIGQRVSDTSQENAALFVHFHEGSDLNIYNPWTLNLHDASNLIGQSVTKIEDHSDSIKFEFDGGMTLVVDLRAEVWTGPEAIVLGLANGPIVVWN